MDGEKRIFHKGESSQEKHGDNDSPYRCWFQRNNRFHAEGSSSSAAAPAPGLAQVYGGAPGWRFQPSDFEMVKYFLPWKTSNQQIPYSPIQEANIYYYDPIKLLEEYQEHAADGRAWYFFTARERKYPNGERPRRDTGGKGLWKAVGKFHNILDTDQKTQIGVRHQLDYYEVNDTNPVKTNIKMHEYVLETKDNSHAETKKRNNESKDGNKKKKKRKKNKPHPDGEEDEENQKQFHALALCKIWIKGDKTLQEYYYPAVPNVEANPEPPFMNMDTAVTDETFQQHNNETLQEYNPAVLEVEANPNPEPSFMNMDTAATDETLQQDVNEILQQSDYDLFGDLETLFPQLLDPVQPPDFNQVMGTFGEPSPSFGDNNWPPIEQNAISDYFYI